MIFPIIIGFEGNAHFTVQFIHCIIIDIPENPIKKEIRIIDVLLSDNPLVISIIPIIIVLIFLCNINVEIISAIAPENIIYPLIFKQADTEPVMLLHAHSEIFITLGRVVLSLLIAENAVAHKKLQVHCDKSSI